MTYKTWRKKVSLLASKLQPLLIPDLGRLLDNVLPELAVDEPEKRPKFRGIPGFDSCVVWWPSRPP